MPDFGSGRVSMPSAPSAGAILPFLLGLVVIAVLWALMQRSGTPDPAFATTGVIEARMPPTINSRQDVIDAFHAIAKETPAVRGNWWTHSRVGRALSKLWPSHNEAVLQLTEVYETARYLPPNEELTPEQLQAAREAIKRCAS